MLGAGDFAVLIMDNDILEKTYNAFNNLICNYLHPKHPRVESYPLTRHLHSFAQVQTSMTNRVPGNWWRRICRPPGCSMNHDPYVCMAVSY